MTYRLSFNLSHNYFIWSLKGKEEKTIYSNSLAGLFLDLLGWVGGAKLSSLWSFSAPRRELAPHQADQLKGPGLFQGLATQGRFLDCLESPGHLQLRLGRVAWFLHHLHEDHLDSQGPLQTRIVHEGRSHQALVEPEQVHQAPGSGPAPLGRRFKDRRGQVVTLQGGQVVRAGNPPVYQNRRPHSLTLAISDNARSAR